MANNRMFLVNRKTGARIMLAKYYPSTGWYAYDGLTDKVNEVFHKHDFGHLNEIQEAANAAHQGFGVPYPSEGGMYGDTDWYIDYEERGDA